MLFKVNTFSYSTERFSLKNIYDKEVHDKLVTVEVKFFNSGFLVECRVAFLLVFWWSVQWLPLSEILSRRVL